MFRMIKGNARERLKGKRLLVIGAIIINMAIVGVLSNNGWVGIFSFFITAPLSVGLSWLALGVYDGEEVAIKEIFTPFGDYGKVLGTVFLVSFYTLLWSLLLIIPGIIKGYAYSQAIYIIKENPDLGIRESIAASQELMRGSKANLFFFELSFIGWILPMILAPVFLVLSLTLQFPTAVSPWALFLGIFTVGYAIFFFIYVMPYYMTAMAGYFRELTKK